MPIDCLADSRWFAWNVKFYFLLNIFKKARGLWWPYITHLNHVIHSIANRDAVLKVKVTLTMTFALVRRNIPTIFEGPSPNHCRGISLFCNRGHCDFAIRVIYWSRQTSHLSSSVLASSTAKLCFLVLKVMVTLTARVANRADHNQTA